MNHQPKRTRARGLLLGGLIGTIVSLGTIAGTASADRPQSTQPKDETVVVVKVDTPVLSLRSGVRW